MNAATTLYCWRHPKPKGAAGRCIGHTNLEIDARQVRHLAYRIHAFARCQSLPKIIYTSDLKRCAAVGQILKNFGWQHVVMSELREMNFGAWEGCTWEDIGQTAVEEWAADFAYYRVGGAESAHVFLQRIQLALSQLPASALLVGHAGVMRAATYLAAVTYADTDLTMDKWPVSPAYGQMITIEFNRRKDNHEY